MPGQERERAHRAAMAALRMLGESVGKSETVFEFSPPGASNLPVAVVMLPKK